MMFDRSPGRPIPPKTCSPGGDQVQRLSATTINMFDLNSPQLRAGPHSDLFSLLYTSLLLLALLSMAASTRWPQIFLQRQRQAQRQRQRQRQSPSSPWLPPPGGRRLFYNQTVKQTIIRGLRADSATGKEVCLLLWMLMSLFVFYLLLVCLLRS